MVWLEYELLAIFVISINGHNSSQEQARDTPKRLFCSEKYTVLLFVEKKSILKKKSIKKEQDLFDFFVPSNIPLLSFWLVLKALRYCNLSHYV